MDYKNLSDEALAQLASGKPVDMTKLSEQDLQEFNKLKPKTLENAEVVPQPSNSSTLEDASVGLGQGLTMGFGDELGAALQSGMDKSQSLAHDLLPSVFKKSPSQMAKELESKGFTGDIGATSSGDVYRRSRDENRKIVEQAAANSPKAFLAGELAGGLVSGIATAPLAPELVAGSTAKGVLPAASRIAAGAINSAPLGAAFGLGESKADLTSGKLSDIKQAAKDTGRGAVTGSLVGAAVSTVPEAYSAGKELLSKIPTPKYLKKLKYNYDLGTNKIDPASPEAQVGTLSEPGTLSNPLASQETDAARQVVDLYKDMDLKLGENVGKAAKDATAEGIRIQPQAKLQETLDSLKSLAQKDPILAETPQYEKISQAIQKANKESLSPEEAHLLKMELGALGARISDTQPLIAREAFNAASALRNEIASAVPEYGMATTRQYEFRQMLPETLLSKGNPVDLTGIRLSDVANYENKLLNNTKNIIKGIDETGAPSSSSKESMTNLLRGLDSFSKAEKSRGLEKTIFDEIGVQPEQIEQHLKDSAFRSSALKSFNEPVTRGGGGSLGELTRAADYAAKKGANLVGRGAAALGKSANPVLDAGKKLYTANNAELGQVSLRLRQDPTGKQLADSLDKALKDNNVPAKNAALFAIMQNPKLRRLIAPEEKTGE